MLDLVQICCAFFGKWAIGWKKHAILTRHRGL